MTSHLWTFKKAGWIRLVTSLLVLALALSEAKCSRSMRGGNVPDRNLIAGRGAALDATAGKAKPMMVERDPIGPVTQEDFNQVLDAKEYSRIHIEAAMPDDAGTGLYSVGIDYRDPSEKGGYQLGHEVDRLYLEDFAITHYIDYYAPPWPQQEVIALDNLMREKNFFNLNVTRDPNGGPDRIGASIFISGYGATYEDYKNSYKYTNVRDTSTPDNAAYFEVMDFIRNHFINWALNNYWCRAEYRNGELISQSGSGCPTLP